MSTTINRVEQFTDAQSTVHNKYEDNVNYYMDKLCTHGPIMQCVKAGKLIQQNTRVSIASAGSSYVIVKNSLYLKDSLVDLCNNAAVGWLHIKNTMSQIHTYDSLQKNAKELFTNKNADYGDAFANFGVVGVLVRIGDKVSRLETSVSGKQFKVNDESILDTLIDLYNYSIMAIMLMQEGNTDNTNSLSNDKLNVHYNDKVSLCNNLSSLLKCEQRTTLLLLNTIQCRCQHKWIISEDEFSSDRTPHVCSKCGLHD